jgi:ActR/RegA family two-component response regulator
MALASAVSVLKKTAARAVLFNIDSKTASVLRDCFKQFGIDTSALHTKDASRLNREKVDACVVELDDSATEILESLRGSPSNRRVVVFGICKSVGEAIRFSKYGINVLLEKPVDRQAVLRAVRATHLLIINEFRRYIRIPIVVNMDAMCGIQHVKGNTVELSGGGMSIRFEGKVAYGDDVQVSFDLPNAPGLKLRGQVCWLRPDESTAGIRFEIEQPAREAVKKWIDEYLDIQ